MCIGGNSAKTDRKETLKAYGDIDKNIKDLTTVGASQTAAGAADTGAASDYFRKIMAGDKSAIAPEIKSITNQADAAKKELATSGTARGGGVNAATQDLNATTRGQVADVINRGRTGAAGERAKIGAQETGQGIGATEAAGSEATSLAAVSGENRKTSQAIHDKAVQDWANAVAAVLMA